MLMVVIRLARRGTRNSPFYQIVVTDNRNARNGRFIERVGFFNPISSKNQKNFFLNFIRITYWIKKGAIVSNRVSSLIKKAKKNN